jgi:hypothetical protein
VPKGILEFYDKTCQDLDGEGFIDWDLNSGGALAPGMICNAFSWYTKTDRWYLEEDNYKHLDEPNSTWFARRLGSSPPEPTTNIMKFFKLEHGERLVTTNGKERPVILLRNEIDDWANPANATMHTHSWLCLPLFSYKDRHNQGYVLNDQRLNNPNAFYIPSMYCGPGINAESAAKFQSIQMIKETVLKPLKSYCGNKGVEMNKPIRLTKTGLRILMYHFFKNLGIFAELEDREAEYLLFKEQINNLLDAAMAGTK